MPHRANLLLSKFHLLITSLLSYLIVSFCLSSCSRPAYNDSFSLTFVIEASPTNLDPRFATDWQSQRIDGLLFSGLPERDNQMYFHGDLAESWSTPDALTYVFHLRHRRSLSPLDLPSTGNYNFLTSLHPNHSR